MEDTPPKEINVPHKTIEGEAELVSINPQSGGQAQQGEQRTQRPRYMAQENCLAAEDEMDYLDEYS